MVELENGYSKPEKKSVTTRLAVLVFIVATLLIMPTWVILTILDGGSRGESRGVWWLPMLWGLWGASSAWIIVDAKTFLRIFSESIVPMGPEECALTLAGIANLVVLALCLGLAHF